MSTEFNTGFGLGFDSLIALVVNLLTTVATTTGATSYVTISISPAANSIIVIGVWSAVTNGAGSINDSGSGTWIEHHNLDQGGNHYFMATSQRGASPGSITITYATNPADAANGCIIIVYEVTGHDSSASAVVQSKYAFGTASTTPVVVMDANLDTDNCYIAVIGNASNPAGLTEPTSWTEDTDIGHAAPSRGGEGVHRIGGEIGATVTWGSTSATVWRGAVIEIAVAPAAVAATKDFHFYRRRRRFPRR